ncbi:MULTISPECIES: sterol desaturase family protein [Rhodomicrobium]|uniref:sterol desaturase family protein n=1 Tax=Rhodomicrobium TaxID=1068 RepID=UPI000B4B1C8C|nr:MULTISPECIES: sterol desaturase family protein [Rhodomicrobium]
MPEWLISLTVFLGVFLGMEGVAWATHKYVMHGSLWNLHESHHRPRKSWFELNDLFGFFFTGISLALIIAGTFYYSPYFWAGLGMAAYGAVYFLVHDVLVHRRVEHGFVPRNGYLRRIYQAHRLHHAVPGKEGSVSFGFLYSPPPEKLAAKLKSQAAKDIVAEDRTVH